MHVLGRIEAARPVDGAARLMCGLLPDTPSEKVCALVSEHEHGVKAGSYEDLIEAQHKFDLMEEELGENRELKADWERIKKEFNVDAHQNAKGWLSMANQQRATGCGPAGLR